MANSVNSCLFKIVVFFGNETIVLIVVLCNVSPTRIYISCGGNANSTYWVGQSKSQWQGKCRSSVETMLFNPPHLSMDMAQKSHEIERPYD